MKRLNLLCIFLLFLVFQAQAQAQVKIYGLTNLGGANNLGTMYMVNQDGSSFTKLHDFNGTNGGQPLGTLTRLGTTKLASVTLNGGNNNNGVVFSINLDGTSFTVIRHFVSAAKSYGLLTASNGKLYGVDGTDLVSINTDGTQNAPCTLCPNYNPIDVANVTSFTPLIELPSGELAGAARDGGASNYGYLFKISKDGSGFTKLYDFDLDKGTNPTNLLLASDGKLYISCTNGGDYSGYAGGFGSILSINLDGTNPVELFDWTDSGGSIGKQPYWGLTEGNDGMLYGTTSFHGGNNPSGLVFKINKNGTGYTPLAAFDGSNGNTPYHGVVQTTDGRLFGTAAGGGSGGTLFSVNPDGSNFNILKNFDANSGLFPSYGNLLFYKATKSNQTITFNLQTTATFGDGPIALNTTASSGLPVRQYTSSNPAIAEVQGNQLIIKNTGSLTITAAQSGNYEYNAAPNVMRTLTIAKQSQNITFGALPAKLVGETPFQLTATATSGLPIVYTSSNAVVATVAGNLLTITGSGSAVITATQPGDSRYNAATPVPQTLTVAGFDGLRMMVPIRQGGAGGAGTILSLNLDGTQPVVNYNFRDYSLDGQTPHGKLLLGADGFMYGTTVSGGSNNSGIIYKIKSDGTGFTKLFEFSGDNGRSPRDGLLSLNGDYYGVTQSGGVNDAGVLFKIKPNGSGYVKLFDFGGSNGNGPIANVILASNGLLYGTTSSGGVGGGIIYRINPDGTGFSKLYDFSANNPAVNGNTPNSGLIQAANGDLYGTTYYGGVYSTGYNSRGVIYKIKLDGSGYTKLFDFSANDGSWPNGNLIQTSNGELMGTASQGGANNFGVIFKINIDGTGYSKLLDFADGNGRNPNNIAQATNGDIYGATYQGGANGSGVIYKIKPDGTAFSKLFDFGGSNGSNPFGPSVQLMNGDLYGITAQGGSNGYGSIYKIKVDGSGFANLYNFGITYGAGPFAGLLQISNGDVFGNTVNGGASGNGTIGRIKPDGTGITKLFDFGGSNGANPYSKLIQASNGYLYGTTNYGGANSVGVIFKMKPDGSGFAKIFDFSSTNGTYPAAGLMQASNGDLYGTTSSGGTSNAGVIFRIKPDGSGFTKLFDFSGSNGVNPNSGLFQTANGDLYGTTTAGGSNTPGGVIYKIKPDGTGFSKIFDFGGGNGINPISGLIQSSNGSLYGTTYSGGANNAGIVYKINPDGTGFTKLVDFEHNNGKYPYSGLTQAPNGDLYGTTIQGGVSNNGVIYKITPNGTYTKILELNGLNGLYAYGDALIVQAQSGPTPNVYVTAPAEAAMGVLPTVSVKSLSVTGATTYTIELNTKPNFTGTSIVLAGTGSTKKFTGLAYNTTYYTRVKTNLSPNWGKSTMFTTGTPESFAYVKTPANNAIGQQVNLTVALNAVIGATNYEVELNTASDFSGTPLTASGIKTSYPYSGLAFNTTYYSRVKTNLSPNWGPTRSFTTGTALQLSYVTTPKDNAINSTWRPGFTVNNIGATSYTVEVSPVSTFLSGVVSATSATTKVNLANSLAYNTQYYTRVTSNLTPGLYGPVRSFTTGNPEGFSFITSPKNLATNVAYTTNITANLLPDAVTYTIEVNESSDFLGIGQTKTGGKTIAFALDEDTQYFARVYTDLDPGNWGTISSFTTGNPLSLAFVTSPKNGGVGVPTTVKVTSNAVPGATSYTIELNTAPDFTGTSTTLTSSSRSITFTGLTSSTTYFTRVQTNVLLGQWGTTSTSFATTSPGARTGNDWMGEEVDEEEVLFEPPTVNVYPVPFSNRLYVHPQTAKQMQAQLRLYDMTGKELITHTGNTNSLMELETTDWAPGLYVIKVATPEGIEVKKIMKQ